MDILSLLSLKREDFKTAPFCRETEKEFIIYLELKIPTIRRCPYCKSNKVHIKDIKYECIKHQCSTLTEKTIVLIITKRRFKCKNCGKTYIQNSEIVEKNCRISNPIRWAIVKELKDFVSFSYVARKFKVNNQTVMNIFDEMIRVGRSAMPTCLCIDEKRFTTDEGKYICIIGNARTSEVVDVIKTRKKAYLNEYFSKIPEIERENTKFFFSDMYEGYRLIKRKFFKNAIHIVDHFHIKRLFTDVLQKIRIEYMNKLDNKSKEYKFLKNNWRYFLVNPYSEKAEKMAIVDKKTGIIYGVKELVYYAIRNSCPLLLEIHNIYSDVCEYLTPEYTRNELENSLDFIINRCLSSTSKHINKLGSTLLNFYSEILAFFDNENQYRLSNASAESINSSIDELISVSHGLRDYYLFRKRVLYILKERGTK